MYSGMTLTGRYCNNFTDAESCVPCAIKITCCSSIIQSPHLHSQSHVADTVQCQNKECHLSLVSSPGYHEVRSIRLSFASQKNAHDPPLKSTMTTQRQVTSFVTSNKFSFIIQTNN